MTANPARHAPMMTMATEDTTHGRKDDMIIPKLYFEILFYITFLVSIAVGSAVITWLVVGTQVADGWVYLLIGSCTFCCISFLEWTK